MFHAPAGAEPGAVDWIYDGDTVVVETGDGELIDVRLMGINAPDSGECFYGEAKDHLIDNLKGHNVALEIVGVDQFDRTLAYLWDGNLNVNRDLLARGMAIASTPRDGDRHGAVLLVTEERAYRQGKGLWGEDCGSRPVPDVRIVEATSTVDPPGPDDQSLGAETITIANEGDEAVSLAGWVLRDESSRHRFVFDDDDILDPGERLTVTSADQGWDPGASPVWNNDGDQAILHDDQGRVVDRWRY